MTAVEVIELELPDAEPERQENRRRAYTPEEAITLARVWHRETGAPPTRQEWDPALPKRRLRRLYERARHIEGQIDRYRGGGYPSASTIIKLFGSWNAFIAACGWEPRDIGRPRIQAAPEPPATPSSDQLRRGAGQHVDPARRKQLVDRYDGPTGASVLGARLRAVVMAQKDGDPMWLAGELESLAATVLAWSDQLRERHGEGA